MEEQKTCNRLNGYLDLTAPDGRVTPCCLLDIKDGWKSNIYDGVNFDDWNGNLRKGCWPCTDNEKNGHESMRQTAIKNGMQISLSFTCNFMCRICKPSLSTRWEKMIEGENFEKFDKDHYYTDPRRKEFVEQQKRFLNMVDLDRMEEVYIVGGEPFFTKRLPEFLDTLPRSCSLKFNTNGSIFPSDAIVSKLKEFKSVRMLVSIDAIGDLAECIRYGTVWKEVDENIQRHIDTWDETWIYSTISALNVNRMEEVYDYAGERSRMNPVHYPNFLRPEQIPIGYRKNWGISSLRGIGDFNNIIWSETPVKSESSILLDFIKTCDRIQGKYFRDVNPEIWNILL